LATILKGSHLFDSSASTATIAVKFKFHKDIIDTEKNRRVIEEELQKISGNKINIKCLVDPKFIKNRQVIEEDTTLEDALEIFEEDDGK